jgi:hypothetical protein
MAEGSDRHEFLIVVWRQPKLKAVAFFHFSFFIYTRFMSRGLRVRNLIEPVVSNGGFSVQLQIFEVNLPQLCEILQR